MRRTTSDDLRAAVLMRLLGTAALADSSGRTSESMRILNEESELGV